MLSEVLGLHRACRRQPSTMTVHGGQVEGPATRLPTGHRGVHGSQSAQSMLAGSQVTEVCACTLAMVKLRASS